jgi:hypothetical protein
MPSVKRAETSVRKYGGRRENLELIYAIEFLFQIKGLEYKKKVPGFVIPSAQEFLEFSKNPEKQKKTKRADEFLKFMIFIAPRMSGNHELLSVSIVVLAIVLYIFTTNLIETVIENRYSLTYEQICQKVTDNLKTEEGMNKFVHPLSYFFTHYLTKTKAKDHLYNLAVDSIRKTVNGIPHLCSDEGILLEHDIQCMSIGQKLIESIHTIFTSYMEVIGDPLKITDGKLPIITY